jgi:hypothetical protein
MATRRIEITDSRRKRRAFHGITQEEHDRVWKWLKKTSRKKFLDSIGTEWVLIEGHCRYIEDFLSKMEVNTRGRTKAMSKVLNNDNATEEDRREAVEDLQAMEFLFNLMFDQRNIT